MNDSLVSLILRSESAWTNFWTFTSGLAGALLGAGLTYYFQKRWESLKMKEERKGMLCKYSLFLDRIYWFAKDLDKNQLESRRKDPIRHINLPAIHTVLPELDIKDPAIELYFLVESNEANVIGSILNIKQRFIGLVEFIGIHNELVMGQLLDIIARHDIQKRDPTLGEIKNYVSQPLYGKLESSTNTIYKDSAYILENAEKVKCEIKGIFKAMYPDGKMLELFNK